jgi:hypothetical protein
MTIQTADPRTTVPESAGRLRPLSEVKPGWWVWLDPIEDGVKGEWAQVRWFAVTNRGNMTLAFEQDASDGDGNSAIAHKDDEVRMLTARDAAKLGLTGKAATR